MVDRKEELRRTNPTAINKQFLAAMQYWKSTTVQRLLDDGADIETHDFYGATALIHNFARPEAVEFLLTYGADVDAQNEAGHTALINAAYNGIGEVVILLLRHNANPNLADQQGKTPLMGSCEQGHQQCSAVLLEHGAAIDQRDHNNHTALDLAIRAGRVAVVEILLSHGATYENGPETARQAVGYRQDGRQLNEAARSGNIGLVQTLLERGIDPNFVLYDNTAPLLLAVEEGHTEIVDLLLVRGASPDPVCNGVDSPLGVAIKGCHTSIVQTLLQAGANPNTQDMFGRTPLYYGISNEEQRLLLLEAGADPNIPDYEGYTVLDRRQSYLASLQNQQDKNEEKVQKEEDLLALLHPYKVQDHQDQPKTWQEYLQLLFSPYLVPEELLTLHHLETELQAEDLSLAWPLGFELLKDEVYDNGLRPEGCLPFAHVDGSGNHFAFLSTAAREKDLATAPIVMYGDDMFFPSARVIAENLRDFLALLITVNSAGSIDDCSAHPERAVQQITSIEADLKSDPEHWKQIDPVRQRLQEAFNIFPLNTPEEYLVQCRREYPKVEEWVWGPGEEN